MTDKDTYSGADVRPTMTGNMDDRKNICCQIAGCGQTFATLYDYKYIRSSSLIVNCTNLSKAITCGIIKGLKSAQPAPVALALLHT